MRFITSLLLRIKELVIWCANAGVKPDMDTQLLKRVQISNIMGVIIGSLTAVFIFIFAWLESYGNAVVVIFETVVLLSIPLQNKIGLIRLSRVLTFICTISLVLLVAMSLGKQSGIHYIYFCTGGSVIFFFTPYEKNTSLVCICY